MKNILFGIGGLILGGLLGAFVWSVSSVILFPILRGLFMLGMAGGGAYLGYQYAKRGEIGSGWRK